ncbi:MAG TPA: hypothetical protein VIU61_03745 [Kofleriaceae bacterium]
MGRALRSLCVVSVVALAVVGCRPIYGNKPDKLANPPKKKRPPDAPETAAEVKYVEDCQTNFRDDKRPIPDTATANRLTGEGDSAMTQSNAAKEPSAAASLIKDAIDKYRNALQKDPFSAEATLKLALAYDKVYRKGCALKLLARISQLESNPKVGRGAKQAADQVADNKEWFKGYRKDAISAVGR